MSSKTIKITNGKILNYKISAPNYKTIYGSKLITADGTITHNMISESDPNGVYAIGDRIGNMATFIGYFDAQDPNENARKYAVFVLDAKYRAIQYAATNNSSNTGLPAYTTDNVLANAKESAGYNTTTIINNVSSGAITAFLYTRNFSITIGNEIFQGQMPNCYELDLMWKNKTVIDSFDPTISDYPTMSISSWGNGNFAWGSNMAESYTLGYYKGANYGAGAPWNMTLGDNFTIPVFEIPVG